MRLRPAKPSPFASPSQLPGELRRAANLMARKQWEEASTLLKDIVKRFPSSKEARLMLLEVARETDDIDLIEKTAEQLAQRAPNDPMILLMWAEILELGGYEALARQQFRSFLSRWPYHAESAEVRQLLRELENALIPQLEAIGLQGESGFEMAALTDEMRYRIEHEEFAQAEELGQTLLARNPHYSPALNNFSMIRFLQGDIAGAVAAVRSVLEFAPDNVHALASMAHFLLLTGEDAEARNCARRMSASTAFAVNRYLKEAETYSFLGEDATVIDVYRRALAADLDENETAMLLPLAAAAYSRSGQEKEAQRLWKEMLEDDPEDNLAEENRKDSQLPVGERHGAWPFFLDLWVPGRQVQELIDLLEPDEEDEVRTAREVRQYVEKYPMFLHILPHLLERGDPLARELALLLARSLRTPEALEALNAFAFSENGPDALRFQATTILSQEGLLDPGMVTFWTQGEWQQTMIMGFEITGEPTSLGHSPQVQKLFNLGMEALQANDYAGAEKLFKEALQSEPKAPDIRNNLAATYSRQGRDEDFKEIILDLYDDYPDYFYARINMATLWIIDDNSEMASQVLKPLLLRKRLHITEFRSLAGIQMRIAEMEANIEEAELWLGMWESFETHPKQEEWRNRIARMRHPIPVNRGRKKRK